MTDTTDALVGTVGGLMAIGIMANVAGNMMNNQQRGPIRCARCGKALKGNKPCPCRKGSMW